MPAKKTQWCCNIGNHYKIEHVQGKPTDDEQKIINTLEQRKLLQARNCQNSRREKQMLLSEVPKKEKETIQALGHKSRRSTEIKIEGEPAPKRRRGPAPEDKPLPLPPLEREEEQKQSEGNPRLKK